MFQAGTLEDRAPFDGRPLVEGAGLRVFFEE